MAELIKLPNPNELPPIDPEADQRILQQLDPVVVPLVNHHINPTKSRDEPGYAEEFPTVARYMGDNQKLWVPAMHVPWSAGENFPPDYKWEEKESPLYEAARSAIILGLLTEDALPWYSEAIKRKFGVSEALKFFANIWTGEEDRHATFLNEYVIVGRLVDPVQLEHDRMTNVVTAQTPDPPSATESLIYVAIQELETRLAHQNTLRLIADTVKEDERIVQLSEDGTELANVEPVIVHKMEPEERASYLRQVIRAGMNRIVGDEGRHHVFYNNVVRDGALQIDPSTVVKALERQTRIFDMPGSEGIPNYWHHANIASQAGILDLRIHRNEAVAPIIGGWGISELEGLDPEAEQARERIFIHMENLDRMASEFEEKREEKRAELADDPEAIWVGKEAA